MMMQSNALNEEAQQLPSIDDGKSSTIKLDVNKKSDNLQQKVS
jgi:hypothetical protein